MNVKYCGPARDYSGYGEANRHDIAALNAAGVNLFLEVPHYTPQIADFGRLGQLLDQLEPNSGEYQIKILHTTPNVYPRHMEKGKYHIGRIFWETDKLPDDFAKPAQMMDEIWTGSEYNADALRNSGVTKPIYVIPQAIDTSLNVDDIEPYLTANSKSFNFYSIFEWTERKNPKALLEAFWREFESDIDVTLTIKTYVDDFSSKMRREIDEDIQRLKRRLNLTHYAPVYLYRRLLDRHQIYRVHKTFDCFVSAHRGEGWGLPQLEAMLMGNPIISTGAGGVHDYLPETGAYLIDYLMVPIVENSRNKQWYTNDQKWAEVDKHMLRQAMRYVFENQIEARELGGKLKTFVEKSFNLKTVGGLMLDRLSQINL